MEPKEAVKKLADSTPKHANWIWKLFNNGEYRILSAQAPDEYDEDYSSICWGWLASGPQEDPIVATLANGERGNEAFDADLQGLVIWIQGDTESEHIANLERAAKALINKSIGMGEFKRIVRENS